MYTFRLLLFCFIFSATSFVPAQFQFQSPEELVGSLTDFFANTGSEGGSFSYQLEGDPNIFTFTITSDDHLQYYVQEGDGEPQLIFDTENFSENAPAIIDSITQQLLDSLPADLRESLEDLLKEAERALQTSTAEALINSAAGPLDDIFSNISLGGSFSGRIMVDPTATGSTDGVDGTNTNQSQMAMSRQLATLARYSRFHFRDTEGNIFGVTLGMQQETENWRYGVLIPYDHVDYDGTSADADSFTVAPFVQYIPMRDPVEISVGPYMFYNYTFINDIDNLSFWGGGVSASIEKRFDRIWIRGGIAGEYIKTDLNVSEDDAIRMRLGAVVGLPINESLEARAFALSTFADEGLVGGDDEFASVGGELVTKISDAFTMNFGYFTSVGHEHLSSHSVFLGGIFALR